MKYQVVVEGRTFQIEVRPGGQVWVDRRSLTVDLGCTDGLLHYSLLVDNRSYETHLEVKETGECHVVVAGRPYRAYLEQRRRLTEGTVHRHQADGPAQVSAPLPGLLVDVRVAEGEKVREGEVVAVLESMKMHMELRSPRPGVVRALCAAAGQEVAQGDVLALVESSP